MQALNLPNVSGLALLATLCIQAAQAAGYQASLSDAEISLAQALAIESVQSVQQRQALPHPSASGLGLQTLLVDIPARKHAQYSDHSRQAEIFLYDYAAQATRFRVIDLDHRQVIRSESLPTHHLPLNAVERQYAREQAAQNKTLHLQIETEFRHFVDSTFAGLSALHSKVTIYEPVLPSQALAQRCLQARCAQITYTTNERVSLPVEPIVVLATGEVHISP